MGSFPNLNFKPIATLLGAVAISLSALFFIENRMQKIAKDAVTEHVDRHTITHGQLPSGIAVPYVKKGQTTFPEGWGLCDPSMDGLFLVGTARLDQVGDKVGSQNHKHKFELRTNIAGGWRNDRPESADTYPHGGKNWVHNHMVEGEIEKDEHLPPATKVLFLCRMDHDGTGQMQKDPPGDLSGQ